MTPKHEDRRRTWRVALSLGASVREVGRNKVPARIVDISTHGCRIEVLSWFERESTISLSFAGLEAKQSRVVWCEGGFAGLEFDSPLSESVLDSVLAAQRNQTDTIVSELRELARRSKHLSRKSANTSADLLRLSKDCSVYALVQALRSAERSAAQSAHPQLTSSMIRRNAQDNEICPGFSVSF